MLSHSVVMLLALGSGCMGAPKNSGIKTYWSDDDDESVVSKTSWSEKVAPEKSVSKTDWSDDESENEKVGNTWESVSEIEEGPDIRDVEMVVELDQHCQEQASLIEEILKQFLQVSLRDAARLLDVLPEVSKDWENVWKAELCVRQTIEWVSRKIPNSLCITQYHVSGTHIKLSVGASVAGTMSVRIYNEIHLLDKGGALSRPSCTFLETMARQILFRFNKQMEADDVRHCIRELAADFLDAPYIDRKMNQVILNLETDGLMFRRDRKWGLTQLGYKMAKIEQGHRKWGLTQLGYKMAKIEQKTAQAAAGKGGPSSIMNAWELRPTIWYETSGVCHVFDPLSREKQFQTDV